jgi:folate-binding protein YgfZ
MYYLGMSLLLNRRLISVRGDGVLGFLQGLVTQDMQMLKSKDSIATLFLNSKGRVMTDALMYKRTENEVVVDICAPHADMITNHLVRHKLRSPIEVNRMEGVGIEVTRKELGFKDPRLPSLLPNRSIVESSEFGESEQHEYRYDRIRLGIVEGQDMPTDSIPIFYNFDLFNTISFNKGCYSGQELVTRTVRRGVVRKRVVPIQSVGSHVFTGTPVTMGERQLGTVLTSQADVGLGLVQIDEGGLNEKHQYCAAVSALLDSEIRIGGTPGRILLPGYCQQ